MLSSKTEIYTFGNGEDGQLGHGDREEEFAPTSIASVDLPSIIQISCGGLHTVLLTKDGRIYTFGDGKSGQLGHRDREDRLIPTLITSADFPPIVQISCGREHTAILADTGIVYTFGNGSDGQLGHVDREDQLIPTPITSADLPRIIQVSCGNYHTALLADNGMVYTFGYGRRGQLGYGDREDRLIPTLIISVDLPPIIRISCGGLHTVLLTEDGRIYTFGSGGRGQLGHGDQKDRLIPTLIISVDLPPIIQISCGSEHTGLLTRTGKVFTFGFGIEGQLGHGD
jgi:alpha-tubulin suppressor-like RCC1 family protein